MARKGERDIVKFNWNQSGMPVSLVSRMGRRSTVAEFKSVLNDAQNQVMLSVDAEATGIERRKFTPSESADLTVDSAITVPSARWARTLASPKSRITVL